jgi:hypothetical protein
MAISTEADFPCDARISREGQNGTYASCGLP